MFNKILFIIQDKNGEFRRLNQTKMKIRMGFCKIEKIEEIAKIRLKARKVVSIYSINSTKILSSH